MFPLCAIVCKTDVDEKGPVFPWLAARPGSLRGCPRCGRTGHGEAAPSLPAAQRAELKLALPYGSAANPVETAEKLRLDLWF